MPERRNFYTEDQLKDPGFGGKPRKAGKAWDVALQLASLRKKSGMSQKELAKLLKTSQQQISRLESPSYEGHSLSMLRRVADVLGATVHVEIQGKKLPTVFAEAIPIYRVKGDTAVKRNGIQKFEMDFLKEGKIDIARNFRIVEALYKEAVSLGIIPLKKPLEGIEVDLKIAKVLNRV
jgi:transcriptional regulator with XRE-family HTH domain